MRVSPTANITDLHPLLANGLPDVEVVLRAFGAPELYITSGHEGFAGDGVHHGASLHYVINKKGQRFQRYGRAMDIRSKTIAKSRWEDCAKVLRLIYRPAQFDVVVESNPPHFHIEFDPK
jgi:hypothetical protein